MPCYEDVKVSIELRAENIDLLHKALTNDPAVKRVVATREGLRVWKAEGVYDIERQGDKLVVEGYDLDPRGANFFNRAYAREAIRSQAKTFGFSVKETSPSRLVATKALATFGLAAAVLLASAGAASAHHEGLLATVPMLGACWAYLAVSLGGAVWAVRRISRQGGVS